MHLLFTIYRDHENFVNKNCPGSLTSQSIVSHLVDHQALRPVEDTHAVAGSIVGNHTGTQGRIACGRSTGLQRSLLTRFFTGNLDLTFAEEEKKPHPSGAAHTNKRTSL